MPYCTKCGRVVDQSASWCVACGAMRTQQLTPGSRETAPVSPSLRGRRGDYCLNCGRSWGSGRSCQFCQQIEGAPTGITLASPMRRLGGYLLELPLFVVTLGIGYFIWSLISYTYGQTPGKQLLGTRVVKLATGSAAGFGLSFLREAIAKPVITVLSLLTFGIVNFWLVWDKDTQELWDKVVGTIVVNDRGGRTLNPY